MQANDKQLFMSTYLVLSKIHTFNFPEETTSAWGVLGIAEAWKETLVLDTFITFK